MEIVRKSLGTHLKTMSVFRHETWCGCRDFWDQAYHAKRIAGDVRPVVVLVHEINSIMCYRSGKVGKSLEIVRNNTKTVGKSGNCCSTADPSVHYGNIFIFSHSKTSCWFTMLSSECRWSGAKLMAVFWAFWAQKYCSGLTSKSLEIVGKRWKSLETDIRKELAAAASLLLSEKSQLRHCVPRGMVFALLWCRQPGLASWLSYCRPTYWFSELSEIVRNR